MAKVHDRILELDITLNAGADSLTVTGVNYYRDRSKIDAADPYVAAFTSISTTSPAEVQLGEVLPPPTHIRFVFSAF